MKNPESLDSIIKDLDLSKDPNLKLYIDDIREYDSVRMNEMNDLAHRAHNGDVEARELLIKYSQKYILKQALRFKDYDIDILDLIQAGNIYIKYSINSYDDNAGYNFIGILQRNLKTVMEKEFIIERGFKKNGVLFPDNILKINNAVKAFEKKNKKTPSVDEISKITKIGQSTIRAYYNAPIVSMSLDSEFNDMEYSEIRDLSINSEDEINAFVEEYSKLETAQELLSCIMPKDRKIVELRMGLNGNQKHSLTELSNILNLTHERVRQKLFKAYKNMLKEYTRRYNIDNEETSDLQPETKKIVTIYDYFAKYGYDNDDVTRMICVIGPYHLNKLKMKFGDNYDGISAIGSIRGAEEYFKRFVLPDIFKILDILKNVRLNNQKIDINELKSKIRSMDYDARIREWMIQNNFLDNVLDETSKEAYSLRFGLKNGISHSDSEVRSIMRKWNIDFETISVLLINNNNLLTVSELHDFVDLNYPKGRRY